MDVVELVMQPEKLVNHFVLVVKNVRILVMMFRQNVKVDVMTRFLIRVVMTLVIKHPQIVKVVLTLCIILA